MIDFAELQDVDIIDLSTWPIWFRWMVIGGVAIGLLFFGYKSFIEPEQETLAKLQREEGQLKQTFLKKKALAVNLPAYREQIRDIKGQFGLVLKQLPDKTEVPALLIDISQAGLVRGLKFKQFKPSKPETKTFYRKLPISITVTGTFHQLAEFISDLASLPRIVTLGDMEMRRLNNLELEMNAQLFTYQYLENDNGQRNIDKKTQEQE